MRSQGKPTGREINLIRTKNFRGMEVMFQTSTHNADFYGLVSKLTSIARVIFSTLRNYPFLKGSRLLPCSCTL